MSEAHIEDHSTPIKTPGQLIAVVLLSFVVPIGTIVLVTQMVTGGLHIDKTRAPCPRRPLQHVSSR